MKKFARDYISFCTIKPKVNGIAIALPMRGCNGVIAAVILWVSEGSISSFVAIQRTTVLSAICFE
jgi:hypothetical protein